MNYEIRRLIPDDAEKVREVRLEGLRLHPEAFSRDYEQDEQLSLDDWRMRLDGGWAWFGGFEGEMLLGIAAFGRGDSSKTRHVGHLGAMYVRKIARGTGLADGIIEAVLDHAMGKVEQVQLTVTAGNIRALKLYERCGFKIVGTLPRALLIGDKYYDEHLMARPLSTSD